MVGTQIIAMVTSHLKEMYQGIFIMLRASLYMRDTFDNLSNSLCYLKKQLSQSNYQPGWLQHGLAHKSLQCDLPPEEKVEKESL